MLNSIGKRNKHRRRLYLFLFSLCLLSIFGFALYYSVTVTWIVVDDTPEISLDNPVSGSVINVNTTQFNWTTTDDAPLSNLTHVWYADVVSTFSSPFLMSVNVSSNQTYNNTTPFFDGLWFWRVEVSDGSNVNVSETWNFSVKVNGTNGFPYLGNHSLYPDNGSTATVFTYNITFYDVDNDTASFVNVTINDTNYSMVEVDAGDTNTSDGKDYTFTTTLPIGSWNYTFSCGDGLAVNSTVVYLGPNVTSNDAPVVNDVYPLNNSSYVNIPLDRVGVNISDSNNNSMNISIYENNSGSWKLVNSSSGLFDGWHNFTNITWVVLLDTTYYWSVNLTDGEYWSNYSFYFTTETINITPVYPSNESSITVTQPTLFFNLSHPSGDSMNYSLYIGNSSINCTILLDNDSGVVNGTFYFVNYYSAVDVGGVYWWRVYANGSGLFVNRSFYFCITSPSSVAIVSESAVIGLAGMGILMAMVSFVVAFRFNRRRDDY